MNINAFESRDVSFEFQMPVDKAIENLRNKVIDPKDETVKTECMVGAVKQHDSYIYRRVPGTRNSFRPTFYGGFTGDESGTVLTGTISLNKVIQKFMYLWLGVVALIAVITFVTIIRNPAASWSSLVQVIFMLGAVYALFVVLKNKCEPDVDWLKTEITQAITGNK